MGDPSGKSDISDRKFIGWVLGLFGALSTAGTIAIVTALVSMGQSLAVVQSNQSAMKDSISELRAEMMMGTQSRYTSAMASNDFASRDRRIDTNGDRISEILEKLSDVTIRINTIETRLKMEGVK